MSSPPAGTVTLLMTDIEGSTRLWEKHGDLFLALLDQHNRCVRKALDPHGGYEVKTEGDSFFFVFDRAQDALTGAVELQRELHRMDIGIRVRVGIHTGEPTLRNDDYYGPQVSRAVRIRDAGHGGMTLLSSSTYALVYDGLPAGISLLDRGEHRLRDLGAPERLYQVLDPAVPQSFPSLRTLEAQPNNLPAQRTSFVGRERELGLLHELLAHGSARLITLTGPGGVGKSRLALQVAADHLIDFPEGVWFISLAHVRDPADVLTEIAVTVLGQAPASPETMRALITHLRDRHVLFVMDSFEHLLPAAPALGELLTALPHLYCLVTSRALLHLTGEHEFLVPSMVDSESLQLLVERGQAVRPGFQPDARSIRAMVSICQQLDGLPLAIELAAARLRGMTVGQIAQRLERRFDILSGGGRDLPDRQRTMRAALDWSYDLLNPDERQLLSQLSVFNGGFFLEAAEEVCDAGDVLDGIFSLRDRSLLITEEQVGETRYRMLTLIREYAAERAEDLSSLRSRHAAHYLKIAQKWGERVNGREQQQALACLDLEIANLEEALTWADEVGDARWVARMVAALGEYAHTRGHIGPHAFEIVGRAIKVLEQTDDTASLAALLFAAGAMAWMQRRFEEGEACVTTSLKYYRSNGLHAQACRALSLLGLIACDQGRVDLARQRFQEGLAICEEAGCRLERALLLQNLSVLEMRQGNDREAERLAAEGMELNRSFGDEAGASYQMHTMGLLAWRRGDRTAGARRIAESLRIRERMGDQPGLARSFADIGRLCMESGDLEVAVLLMSSSHRLETAALLPVSQEDMSAYEEAKGQLDAPALDRITAQAAEMPVGHLVEQALKWLDDG